MLSIAEYKRDKIAYVFDSTLEGVKSTGLMVSSEVEAAIEKVKLALHQPLSEDLKLHTESQQFFNRESSFQAFYIVAYDQNTRQFTIKDRANKGGVNLNQDLLNSLASEALQSKLALTRLKENVGHWGIALPLSLQASQSVVAIAIFNRSSFLDTFYSPQILNYYLADPQNKIVWAPVDPPYLVETSVVEEILSGPDWESRANSFVREFVTGEDSLLIASSKLSLGNYKVIALVPKSVALEALRMISLKSLLLVTLLIGASIVLSVIGASRLTKNLSRLYKAVVDITKGHLDTRVNINSRDEVGVLAEGFNMMTERIQSLLKETAEKARMQNELQTAQTVQATLFPPNHFVNPYFEIYGYYEPASECGGDWYSYTVMDDAAYFWIGDATGHGVSAALITSAAKSGASVIQTISGLKMSQIMSLMNRAVTETSGGSVLMTFIVAKLDFNTGILEYSNASHDSPYILRKQEAPYKRNDIEPILGENGPRLGETLESQYFDEMVALQPGDRVVFYTDGVPEILNNKNEQWGEGKFVRSMVKAFNSGTNIKEVGDELIRLAYDFRGDEILHDDVTCFILEYKGGA